MGMRLNGFLCLACPECDTNVEAFTAEGLAAAWNKQASTEDAGNE